VWVIVSPAGEGPATPVMEEVVPGAAPCAPGVLAIPGQKPRLAAKDGGHAGGAGAAPGEEQRPRAREEALGAQTAQRRTAIERRVSERNARFFDAEAQKLDGWADDLKVGLEREIKEMDRQIREARRAATAAVTLEEKLAGQRQVKALEGQRTQKRRTFFDAQDEVDRQRDRLIAETEAKLAQAVTIQPLFSIRWSVR